MGEASRDCYSPETVRVAVASWLADALSLRIRGKPPIAQPAWPFAVAYATRKHATPAAT